MIKIKDVKSIDFFLDVLPPTKTYQQKKISCKYGKPIIYEPKELKETRRLFELYLNQYAPKEPFNNPISLSVQWNFPYKSNHKDGEYKYTRPDLDNLQKLLQDVMTTCGFWKDDSLICELQTSKVWNNKKMGIYIKIKELESTKGKNKQ